MSFLAENWFLIVTAVVSGGLLAWSYFGPGSGAGLSVAQAVQLINREKGVVIDVCEPAEYAQGHVAGSRNIPLASLGEADKSKGLPANKTLPVIVVCASGIRARKAAAQLKQMGYERAEALAGGLKAWREASMPVEKSA